MSSLVENFNANMAPPSAKWMRMGFLEHDSEKMRMRLSFQPNDDMINFGGVIQGGFLVAMMDDAMGFNAFMALEMKRALATIDLHTHFMRPVPKDLIEVETNIINLSRSVIFADAELFDCNGKLSAKSSASMKIRPVDGSK